MSYPDVQITNSTSYNASGTVSYMSIFCSNDNYSVTPTTTWSHSRGVCLITEISAVVQTPNGKIQATPYTSSGTSYSQFAIIQTSATSFEVTRRVSLSDDAPPADYVEPTEHQK